jgi:hypothetical protein
MDGSVEVSVMSDVVDVRYVCCCCCPLYLMPYDWSFHALFLTGEESTATLPIFEDTLSGLKKANWVCRSTGARARFMVYGLWFMVYGVWCMVYGGVWCMVYGVWLMVYGLRARAQG